jgi:hypothetical protein
MQYREKELVHKQPHAAIARHPEPEANAQTNPSNRIETFSSPRQAANLLSGDKLSGGQRRALVQRVGAVHGNRQVQNMLHAAKTPPTVQRETSTDAQKKEHERVNAIVDGFQSDVLKKQIGSKIEGRMTFMRNMPAYFGGSEEAMVKHYGEIKKIDVPGEVHLHPSAGDRLLDVYNEVGASMPETTVALGLRGNQHAHPDSLGSMPMHGLGLAIDYFAVENPHLTDGRLHRLVDRVTGGPVRMNLGNWETRRKTIEAIGEKAATPEGAAALATDDQVLKFFATLEKEYVRVAQLSDAFQGSLDAGAKAQLNALHDLYVGKYLTPIDKLGDEIKALPAKIRKAGKSPKAAELQKRLEAAIAEKAALEQQLPAEQERIKAQLPGIFASWLQIIRQERQRLENQVPNLQDVPFEAAYNQKAGELKNRHDKLDSTVNNLRREATKAQKALDQYNKKKNKAAAKAGEPVLEATEQPEDPQLRALEDKLATAQGKLALSETELNEVKRELGVLKGYKPLIPLKNDWANLDWLEKSLSSDLHFVFVGERNAKNPSVHQLVNKGLFRADDDLATLAQAQANPTSAQPDASTPEVAPPPVAVATPEVVTPTPAPKVKGTDWNMIAEFLSPAMQDALAVVEANEKRGVSLSLSESKPAASASTPKKPRGKQRFDLLFLKTMVKHGFDLGVAWGPGSTDPMHFEHIHAANTLTASKDE